MRDEVCTIKSTPQVAQPSLNADIVVGESSRPLHRGIYSGGVLMSRRRSRKRDAGHVSMRREFCEARTIPGQNLLERRTGMSRFDAIEGRQGLHL